MKTIFGGEGPIQILLDANNDFAMRAARVLNREGIELLLALENPRIKRALLVGLLNDALARWENRCLKTRAGSPRRRAASSPSRTRA